MRRTNTHLLVIAACIFGIISAVVKLFNGWPCKSLLISNTLPAVERWLAIMDGGNYTQSWDIAAPYFQRAMAREEWVSRLEKTRHPLGKVLSRKLNSTNLMAAGMRFAVKFKTSFDGLLAAVETVTFALQSNGEWQAIGYLIRPFRPRIQTASQENSAVDFGGNCPGCDRPDIFPATVQGRYRRCGSGNSPRQSISRLETLAQLRSRVTSLPIVMKGGECGPCCP